MLKHEVIGAIAPTKERIQTINAGAGRGYLRGLDGVRTFNETSDRFEQVQRVFDPSPGRAREAVAEATRLGIRAEAFEGTAQDILRAEGPEATSPLIIRVDSPREARDIVSVTAGTKRYTMGGLILSVSGNLFALWFCIPPHQRAARESLLALLDSIAKFRAPRGSDAIFGSNAKPEHFGTEDLLRDFLSKKLAAALPKAVAKLEIEGAPIELSDGVRSMPVFVHQTDAFAADPSSLARDFAENPPEAIMRGEDFAVIELAPKGMRLHRVRLRRVDGRPSLGGSAVALDETTTAAAVREDSENELRRDQVARIAAAALARAERNTVSLSTPLLVTD